ncbi:MAG: hypothetical protein AAFR47_18135 [Pseudomonadota bacterium]
MMVRAFKISSLALFSVALAASASWAHEAWILTPREIEALAEAPIPALFLSQMWLLVAAALSAGVALAALSAEDRFGAEIDARLRPLASSAVEIGPTILRISTGLMLGLAALGGLPRHGVEPWTTPTFLVPDMALNLVPGWDILAPVQFALALFLILGLAVRLCGAVLVALSVLGLAIFGAGFVAYAPHFAAPGIMLMLAGSGAAAVDRLLGTDALFRPGPEVQQAAWRATQILVGAGFIYLAVAYKLFQPTLIIAILDHGNVPTLGLPLPVVALLMTSVEITAGALLVMGRLVRPMAALLIGAMTFLAVVLGETPLFHANLYGVMVFYLMVGERFPRGVQITPRMREAM